MQHHEAGTFLRPSCGEVARRCSTLLKLPPERHTAFMWEKLPYALHGDPAGWDRKEKSHGQSMLNLWTEYAPNLKHAVLDWFVRSPLDTERTLPNMAGGDLLVGAFGTWPGWIQPPVSRCGTLSGARGRDCIFAEVVVIPGATLRDSSDITAPKSLCRIWDCPAPWAPAFSRRAAGTAVSLGT